MWPPKHEHGSILVVEKIRRRSFQDSERVSTHQAVTGVSRVKGSTVDGVGASSVEGFSFSSTPCPRHSGQEFRPLVSHYQTTVSQMC